MLVERSAVDEMILTPCVAKNRIAVQGLAGILNQQPLDCDVA